MTWPDGRQYTGGFKNDKKHGYGEFKNKNGNIQKGEWRNNQQEGQGMMILANGETMKCKWEGGKMLYSKLSTL